MTARYPRFLFWSILAAIFGAAFLNQERIAREVMVDVQRDVAGQPKIDRRPS